MIKISELEPMCDLNEMIYFEGKLYERLSNNPTRHKYRVILAEDDYDYVEIPALRKRLNRAFKRSDKNEQRK